MPLYIGNAPCSWGVEFPDASSNPPWQDVLAETSRAGYRGTELGPIGFMPEDAAALGEELAERGLALTAGVVFRPFHDPDAWEELQDAVRRTCRMLRPLGARHLVFIDSLSAERSAYAGDQARAPRLDATQLAGMHERIRAAAVIGRDEYGLLPSIHAHAGGCVEFEDELERVLDAVDETLLGICLDTGHSLYAGFDPVALFRRHAARVSYIHLKDLDAAKLRQAVAERVGFYEACARGVFCHLGDGAMDFPALKAALEAACYQGWATVEQDRGPLSVQSSFADAVANLRFLRSVGLALSARPSSRQASLDGAAVLGAGY